MPNESHRGNKQRLPSKPCQTCGLPMTWRRAWALNWDAVRHCSDACRKRRRSVPVPPTSDDADAGR